MSWKIFDIQLFLFQDITIAQESERQIAQRDSQIPCCSKWLLSKEGRYSDEEEDATTGDGSLQDVGEDILVESDSTTDKPHGGPNVVESLDVTNENRGLIKIRR